MTIKEPADAIKTPFPCWICDGPTRPVLGSCSRFCEDCEVLELRRRNSYIPRVRFEKTDADGRPYLDHSRKHYPSPA